MTSLVLQRSRGVSLSWFFVLLYHFQFEVEGACCCAVKGLARLWWSYDWYWLACLFGIYLLWNKSNPEGLQIGLQLGSSANGNSGIVWTRRRKLVSWRRNLKWVMIYIRAVRLTLDLCNMTILLITLHSVRSGTRMPLTRVERQNLRRRNSSSQNFGNSFRNMTQMPRRLSPKRKPNKCLSLSRSHGKRRAKAAVTRTATKRILPHHPLFDYPHLQFKLMWNIWL